METCFVKHLQTCLCTVFPGPGGPILISIFKFNIYFPDCNYFRILRSICFNVSFMFETVRVC